MTINFKIDNMRKTLVALTCAVACLMSCVFTSCSSCNKKSDKDFAAEITRIMNDFQKLCENTYTNESMDEQQKEAFLDSRYDSLCNVLMDLTDEAMEVHKADSLSVDALEFQVQLQLVSDEDALLKLDALDPAVRQSASAIKLRGYGRERRPRRSAPSGSARTAQAKQRP